jgi:hypothetical protein
MKIPKTIQIGPYTFAVEFQKNLWSSEDYRGKFAPSSKKIILDAAMDKAEYLPEVFLHEVLEAIKWTYNLDIPHKELNFLGLGLFQVLRTSLESKQNARRNK